MKIILSGKEVILTPRDVKMAKKINTEYLTSVKNKAEQIKAPSMYFTTLVLMHLQTQELLNAVEPETIQLILNSSFKRNEKNKKKTG